MLLIISTVLSALMSFSLVYFIFFLSLPESIKINGFINFLMSKDAIGGLIGGFIGMMALNLIVILPFLITLPQKIRETINSQKLKKLPIKTIGKILNIERKSNTSILDISFNNYRKSFSVPNILTTDNLNSNRCVTVFYDPSNPENSYLDLIIDSKTPSENPENSVFKLLEINPKFDVSSNSYQLIGEIHSESFKGQKASLVYELDNKMLSSIIPGKIFPCTVSGMTNNYNIDIEIR